MQSKSEVIVTGVVPSGGGCANCRYVQDQPTNVTLPDASSSVPVLPDMGTGQAQIYFGGTDAVLDKPLIIIEGFDPTNTRDASVIFKDGLLGTLITVDGLKQEFFKHLDDNNFDIVYLNFTDATTDIRRNARLLEYLIQWVNQKKNLNGSTEKNVVMGASMGGLVACYGLRDMEIRGINHDTKLYGSFDTAHLGVNAPLGFQAAIRYMAGLSVEGIQVPKLLPALGYALNTINSTAVQQMLIYQWQGNGSGITVNNTPHTSFLTEYSSMGMPRLWGIRNIAVANGSECGVNQGYQPYTSMISVNQNIDIKYFVNLLIWGFVTVKNQDLFLIPSFFGARVSNLLTTDSDILISAELKSLPDKQALPVFTFNLSYKKVILWGLITKTKTLFSTTKSSTADMLPLDSSPGGRFGLSDYNVTIPPGNGITVNETKFAFLPTPSALYIGAGTQTITTEDLNNPYSRAFPPAGLKSIPFDNFFSNPVSNEKHVQITEKNGAWMFNEFRGTPQIFSCSYACNNSSIAPVLSGPSTICNSTVVFGISNVLEQVQYTWQTSSNITPVSGQGTNSFTVTRNASGNGFIKIVVTGVSCGMAEKQLDVRLGGYSSSDYPVFGPTSVCSGQSVTYNTNNLLGATNYAWFWPTSWTYVSGNGSQYLSLIATNTGSNGSVGVRVANACDTGGSPSVLFVSASSCGMFSITLSPNPASTTMTAELIEQEPTNNQIESIEVMDASGAVRLRSLEKGKKVEMQVSSLPKGYNYVRVRINGETSVTRIIIE